MRTLLAWVLVILLLAGGLYLGSPYYSTWRLVQAARAADGHGVAAYVDFPAVRASLKPQLEAYVVAEAAREQPQPHSLWDRLKLAVAPYLAGPAGELLVTPQNVAAMVRTGRPPHVVAPAGGAPRLADDETGPGDARILSMGYVGDDLDQFQAAVASRAHPARRVDLRLLRRGFFSWKVVTLDLAAFPKRKAAE